MAGVDIRLLERRCQIARIRCSEKMRTIFDSPYTPPETITPPPTAQPFPFEKAYPWQVEAIEKIMSSKKNVAVRAPTGAGKTAVLITTAVKYLNAGEPVVWITIRNYLQDQLKEYRSYLSAVNKDMIVLKGRDKYPCPRAYACLKRFYIHGEAVFYYAGRLYTYPCMGCAFEAEKKKAKNMFLKREGIVVLNHGNFWPYRGVKDPKTKEILPPSLVLIDEADEFVKYFQEGIALSLAYLKAAANGLVDAAYLYVAPELTQESEVKRRIAAELLELLDNLKKADVNPSTYTGLVHSVLKGFIEFYTKEEIFLSALKEQNNLLRLIKFLQIHKEATLFWNKILYEEIKDKDSVEALMFIAGKINTLLDSVERVLTKLEFYLANIEKVYVYEKNGRVYVNYLEIDMRETIERLFPNSRVILCSATIPNTSGNWEFVDGSVEFPLNKIYIVPLIKMTYTNLIRNENVLSDVIRTIAEHFLIPLMGDFKRLRAVYSNDSAARFLIHISNIQEFGKEMYEVLQENGLNVKIHEIGKLDKTIEDFLSGRYDVLIVSHAERGLDLDEPVYGLQFIAKIPYRQLYSHGSMDPELLAIKRLLGQEKFNQWYEEDAGVKMLQACGRNARRPENPAFTVIFDARYFDNYRYLEKAGLVPDWFRKRVEVIDIENGTEPTLTPLQRS
ncbi:MAG: helicase C-terminal domain-containing protein [Desulfurococcaceae archaeon]